MRITNVLLAMMFMMGLVGAAQAKIVYQEDFKNWRDESTNKGFNADFKVLNEKKGIVKISTDENNSYGKVMSPEGGITVNITKDTEISMQLLNDIPKGDVKVHLMTAGEPYDSHTVIGPVTKKGVYTTKISNKVPWSGKHTFWIEIWVEGINRTAQIKDIMIREK